MSEDAPLLYCRPKECSYCVAFVANIEKRDERITELEAELAALLKTMRAGGCRDCDDLAAELEKAQWAITQWQADEDDWVRDRAALEAEVARLNLVCARVAAAGHSDA